MSKDELGDDWDFSPVIDLIYSLSPKRDYHDPCNGSDPDLDSGFESSSTNLLRDNTKQNETELGNFNRIWQYLGRPLHISVKEKDAGICAENKTAGELSGVKEVRWRDEINGADLADDDADDGKSLSGLSKQQRKKARRRQRRAASADNITNAKLVPTSSENESEREVKKFQTRDRKEIINQLLHENPLPKDIAKGRIRVLKRPEDEKWPIAKPHVTNGVLQASNPSEDDALARAIAKRTKLITMLNERFIEERPYLSNLNISQHQDSDSSGTSDGIHIFVDASNIMIGFHECLKRSHAHPPTKSYRRQPFSFHSLSLILSRGRPTTKRILVGSDNFPAITEAKLIGYETNILDRVHKAKELTPRQKRFLYKNAHTSTGNGGPPHLLSTGSGSETTTPHSRPVYAPEKWVEQAVDEILHLKMMESLVDASSPSTMVLATGDAAEAEYSAGFLKMVERALLRGWRVEVVSWRKNLSVMYQRREWTKRWGERFKRVELDEFVEVLVGGEGG